MPSRSNTSPATPIQLQPALLAKFCKYWGLVRSLVNGNGENVAVAVADGPGVGVSVGVGVGVRVGVGGGKVGVTDGVKVGGSVLTGACVAVL